MSQIQHAQAVEAAKRLQHVFHEDEHSPLAMPEEDDHIRDDVLAVCEFFSAPGPSRDAATAETCREFVWRLMAASMRHAATRGEGEAEREAMAESFAAELLAMFAGGTGDDGEAVTEEWLLAEGWEPVTHRGDQNRWNKTLHVQRHDDDGGSTLHWLTVHRSDDGLWWPIDLRQRFMGDNGRNDPEEAVALLPWLDVMTRGHIRNLIAALSPTEPAK